MAADNKFDTLQNSIIQANIALRHKMNFQCQNTRVGFGSSKLNTSEYVQQNDNNNQEPPFSNPKLAKNLMVGYKSQHQEDEDPTHF